MAALTLWGRPIETVFDLLGRKENDLTYSLGWGFANIPEFGRSFLEDVDPKGSFSIESIDLQRRDSDGVTDIEIVTSDTHLVIEAKRGWLLPTERQLRQYIPRLLSTERLHRQLMVLSGCSDDFARRLPSSLAGVPVVHRSWSQVIVHASASAYGVGTHQQKPLARQLVNYLKGATNMHDPSSNIAYCVSLSGVDRLGRGLSSRDLLERSIYFHPFDWQEQKWPRQPENFMAFRWSGCIRDIRHVEATQVVGDLHDVVPDFPSDLDPDHRYLVYHLGPSIPMPRPLPSGVNARGSRANYQADRFRVAVDLVLTSESIAEAVAKTKARLLEE